MKRAVILHGTSSHPSHNWQPWIKGELEKEGYEVFAPELPQNDAPDQAVYDNFLRTSGWDFTDNLLIGHSSGATAILNLLSTDWLPHVKTVVLVGTFLNERLLHDVDWYNEQQFKNLFPKDGFDVERIKTKVDHIYFIHGEEDPLCDFGDAREFCKKLDGTFVPVASEGHFSSPTTELPAIIDTLRRNSDL